MGRRIKFKLQDTTPARIVWLDPDATEGATLGTNVFLPDGTVGTPKTVRAWLGVEEAPDLRAPPRGGSGVTAHRLLQGLPLGDDHPQYTQWVQDEVITGYWSFQTIEGLQIEHPDRADSGIRFRLYTPVATEDGIGGEMAFWEDPDHLYGIRLRHTGEEVDQGDLDFYRHNNNASGVLFLRFTRDSSQIQFVAGSASAPIVTTLGDLNTGLYFPAADTVGLSTGGSLRFSVSNTAVTSTETWLGPNGSASAPAYSFTSDTNIGMFRISENLLGFATSGIERLRIGNGTDQYIRSTLVYEGPAGSATAPTFSFSTDENSGMYSVGADQIGWTAGGTLRLTLSTTALVSTLPISGAAGSAGAPSYSFTGDLDTGAFQVGADQYGIATAGTERLRIDATGAWGLAGANFGAAGQVLTSNGSGAAPTWQTSSGGGTVASVVAGHGIGVDDYADPGNPIVFVDESDGFYWTGHHTFDGSYVDLQTELRAGGMPGTLGQLLFSQGVGAIPQWVTRILTAGAGLTGGGDLSADRTFDVGAGTGITVNANDVALSAATIASLALADTAVQPARLLTAGAGLTGGGDLSADRTFNVGAGTGITVNADDVALDTTHARNVDHTAVVLTAGAGLIGGGDISASRTFDIGAGTGITVNANDVALSAASIASLALADSSVQTLLEGHGIEIDDYLASSPTISVDEATDYVWTNQHTFNARTVFAAGSPTAPSIAFADDLDTGIYSAGADQINFSIAGVLALSIGTVAIAPVLQVRNQFGTAALPSYAFAGDNDTGMLRNGVNQLELSAGGTSRLLVSTTRVSGTVPIQLQGYTVATLPAGTVGDTAYVTDALAPVYGAAVTPGGAVTIPVFYNGAAWITA